MAPSVRAAVRITVTLAALLAACGDGAPPTAPSPAPAAAASPQETSASQETSQPGAGRALRILSPTDGEGIGIPFEVRYEIEGFEVGPGAGHLHVRISGVADPLVVELPIKEPAGIATVGDKRITGRRDLIFVLARADHGELSGTAVEVKDLTIVGPR